LNTEIARLSVTLLITSYYLVLVFSNSRRGELKTAIGLTPGGSSTSHIYTQTIHIIQRKETLGSAGRAPSLRVIPWHLPYN
jgi:hypothetical protein